MSQQKGWRAIETEYNDLQILSHTKTSESQLELYDFHLKQMLTLYFIL